MKSLLLVCFALSTLSIYSQDYTSDYLDMYMEVTKKSEATYERYLNQIDEEMFKAEIKDLSGKIKAKGYYILVDGELIPHGKFEFYYYNGQLESEGFYKMGYKVETWKRFMKDGTERPSKYYKSDLGSMIENLID